jgi:hypothetical protein
MGSFKVSQGQLEQFREDGYFIVDELLQADETRLLADIARADFTLANAAASRRDGAGGSVKLTVSNELADDIYGAIVRSRRIVDAMEQLLGGEVYHYHHKMIQKDPYVGGAWEWHQDYGYWYHNGCLFPLLASCMIAVDRAMRGNGCLQVLKGSHLMGRLDHGKIGDQTGADLERVEEATRRLATVHVELPAGGAVFFHCNLLHRSDQNKSAEPRWAFICCYNAARNDPYKESRHPRYSRLEKLADTAIGEIGRRQLSDLQTAHGGKKTARP